MSWPNAEGGKGKMLTQKFVKAEHLNKLERTSVDDGMTEY
jgi:hypothetical protein